MKLRQLIINTQMLLEWFSEGRKTIDYIVAGGIPDGSKLAGLKYNAHTGEIAFVIANDDFPESESIKNLQITIMDGGHYEYLSSLDDESSLD